MGVHLCGSLPILHFLRNRHVHANNSLLSRQNHVMISRQLRKDAIQAIRYHAEEILPRSIVIMHLFFPRTLKLVTKFQVSVYSLKHFKK